jgi:hypothetical protein
MIDPIILFNYNQTERDSCQRKCIHSFASHWGSLTSLNRSEDVPSSKRLAKGKRKSIGTGDKNISDSDHRHVFI